MCVYHVCVSCYLLFFLAFGVVVSGWEFVGGICEKAMPLEVIFSLNTFYVPCSDNNNNNNNKKKMFVPLCSCETLVGSEGT